VIGQLPYLLQVDASGTLAVVSNGTTARYFDRVGTSYQPRFYVQDQLTPPPGTGPGDFVLTDTVGDQLRFAGFTADVPPNDRGQFDSFTDPYGNRTFVTARTPDGKVTEVRRTIGSATESYLYRYLPAGVSNAGLLENVTLRRSADGGATWMTVRQVEYAYYDGSQPYGNAGNLRTATIEDAAGTALDTDYYRYYTAGESGGYVDGLKFAFGPASYARLVAAVGDPSRVADAQVAPYAADYFQYDSQHRVTREVAAGAGNAGGQGTFDFSYAVSTFAPGYNNWFYKTVESLPDGNSNIVYSNAYGEVMLQVFADQASGQQWATFSQYDGQGRLALTADPSAVSGYDETRPDLLNNQGGHYQYLRDNAGLITVTDYYTSTTATETTPGGVAGYVQDYKLKRGQLGTPVAQWTTQYFAHTGGGATIYPVAATTAYRNSDGTGAETTRYAYTYYPNTTRLQSQPRPGRSSLPSRMVPAPQTWRWSFMTPWGA
jgi:hypothetical protein